MKRLLSILCVVAVVLAWTGASTPAQAFNSRAWLSPGVSDDLFNPHDLITRSPLEAAGYRCEAVQAVIDGNLSVDVSSYADGGSHTLAFHSQVFGVSGTTNFWIDDVDLITAGTPGGGDPAGPAIELPSLGTSAMIGLGALLAMFGFAGLRRRRMN